MRMMVATKTTFYLSTSLRSRLKTLAAQTEKTMSELLAEGAEFDIGIAFTADRHFHRAGPRVRPLFERTGAAVSLHLPDD